MLARFVDHVRQIAGGVARAGRDRDEALLFGDRSDRLERAVGFAREELVGRMRGDRRAVQHRARVGVIAPDGVDFKGFGRRRERLRLPPAARAQEVERWALADAIARTRRRVGEALHRRGDHARAVGGDRRQQAEDDRREQRRVLVRRRDQLQRATVGQFGRERPARLDAHVALRPERFVDAAALDARRRQRQVDERAVVAVLHAIGILRDHAPVVGGARFEPFQAPADAHRRRAGAECGRFAGDARAVRRRCAVFDRATRREALRVDLRGEQRRARRDFTARRIFDHRRRQRSERLIL